MITDAYGHSFDPMATALENIGRDLLATQKQLDATTARAERAEAERDELQAKIADGFDQNWLDLAARAATAEAEVEMQRDILRRVRDLQARAEGYDFTIDPADLLAALDGTENTGGTDG